MSLASTYQACKDLLASKLNAKGITASGSEGLTTLINKVGNLSADGLLLRGDHSVAQSGTTVNLTAVYMENGVVVPWKLVNFYGLKAASGTSKNLTGNTYNAVGCKYIFTTNPFGTVYLDREGNVRLFSSGSSASSQITLYVDDESVAVGTYGSSSISVEDGYITFDNTVVDCREYDLSVIRPFSNSNGGVISDFGVFDTTDDNGVATATYTCTGAGKQTVKAISGSVVSEPVEVWDTLFYDSGILNDPLVNNNWSSTTDFTRETDGTTYTVTTWTTRWSKVNNSEDITLNSGLTIELDVSNANQGSGGTVYVTVYDGNGYRNMSITGTGHWKIVCTDKVRKYKDNGTTALQEESYTSTASTVKVGVVGSSGSPSMKFTDFKVYYG